MAKETLRVEDSDGDVAKKLELMGLSSDGARRFLQGEIMPSQQDRILLARFVTALLVSDVSNRDSASKRSTVMLDGKD